MVPMALGSRKRVWRSGSLALLGALLGSSALVAQDLPGAVPGSTIRIEVPRGGMPADAAAAAPVAAEPAKTETAKAETPPPVASAPIVPPAAAALPRAAEPAPAGEPKAAASIAPPEQAQGRKESENRVEAPAGQDVRSDVAQQPASAPLIDEAMIRAFLEPRRAKFRLKPEEVAGFVAAYGARGGKPFFLAEAGGSYRVSPHVEAVVRTVGAADVQGLDAQRLTALLPARRAGMVEGNERSETELSAAFAAFIYARDARGGRLEPARLSALTTPTLYLPSAGEVLEAIGSAPEKDVQSVLEGFNPRHEGFKRLREALARLNEPTTPVITANVASAPGGPTQEAVLPPDFMAGGPIKLGQVDPRVPNLRIRLNMPASASNVFDAEVRGALISFQKANGLTANGWLTPRTRAALENRNTPTSAEAAPNDKRAQKAALLVNMERWRWLPPELGARHVFVNIPAYQLRLMDNGAAVHEARVIVGKPETQTPVFSDTFAHVIVNPSWFVPPSILKKEFLPRLASDPSYAARRGFEVVQTRSGISVRQPPGERNALGNVKFIFPNRHAVYLHDTPNRNLFANDSRAFSHGCVRVDKPFALAEKLLSQSGGFSEPQLKGMVGRGERMIKLADKVNVHLSYFTLDVDDSGILHRYRDLYGHDARVRAALAL